MIRYIIIDDEYVAHDIIRGYCDLLPDMQWVKSCYDALEALAFLKDNPVDLIFLDLNLPKLKGFEFLKTLRNPPAIIVTTAYREFALESYELNVSDYLLKPFSLERLLKAVNKTFGTPSVPARTTQETGPERLILRSQRKYFQVETDKILYIEAFGNYTKVISSQETIVVREKFSDIKALLPENDFLQVHKSFVVAKRHIKSVEGNRIFMAEHVLPAGRMYRMNIDKFLGTELP